MYAYSLLEGTGLTCKMKNRNQLTPPREIYDVNIYSIEGERVTSFPILHGQCLCKNPFPNSEKCPVSQAGNKAYALPNMSCNPKAALRHQYLSKDTFSRISVAK